MGWAAGPGVGGVKAFELRGAGEGIERLEGAEARGLPSARHLFRHPVGVEATQVSGNGTKVLSLVCGFGIQSFVPYIWDIPRCVFKCACSKGAAAFELSGPYDFRGSTFAFDLTARVAFSIPSILQQLSLKAPCH